MKSMIYVPIFFLTMLFGLIVYDIITNIKMRNDLLLKEDRIRFHDLVIKAGHTQHYFDIDSFHYIVFVQPHNHQQRMKMFARMDSIINIATKMQ